MPVRRGSICEGSSGRLRVLKSVQGTYRDGRIELEEHIDEPGPVRVIVTFLAEGQRADLAARGIVPERAADLRSRLKAFDADWDRSDMDGYDAL
jgi:hypothetical protein